MQYNKKTWAEGDRITSAALNNMEDGIANASAVIVNLTEVDDGVYTADKTADEIAAAFDAGRTVIVAGDGFRTTVSIIFRSDETGAPAMIMCVPILAFIENVTTIMSMSYQFSEWRGEMKQFDFTQQEQHEEESAGS